MSRYPDILCTSDLKSGFKSKFLVSPVSLRLLLNIYTGHVTWNIVCSEPFSVFNGVKHSSVLFGIHLGGRTCRLSESKIGVIFGNMVV